MKFAACIVLGCCVAGGGAVADDAVVSFAKAPAVRKGVAAYPRLVGADPIIARINAALAKGDGRVRKGAKECFDDGKGQADWSRTVDVTMKGPRFVSYVSHDEYFCGGAYPDVSTMALVYDLSTGIPVDWAKMLPASLAVTAGTSNGADGTVLGTIASAKLGELYRAAAKADGGDAECDDVLKETEFHFILWPDARANGIGLMQMDLPHVTAACGPALTIPMAKLRELGIDAGLLDAIETAHKTAK